jgi:hypothetical protein
MGLKFNCDKLMTPDLCCVTDGTSVDLCESDGTGIVLCELDLI